MPAHLRTEEIASLEGVSVRAARAGLARIYNGKSASWRGMALRVDRVPGQRGKFGYRIEFDSLPADVQERLRNGTVGERPLRHDTDADRLRTWRYNLIAPALAHPKRSAGRGAAVAEIASRTHYMPNGETRTYTETRIRRWIRDYEKEGMRGLQKAARADKGTKRVCISRAWDSAVPFDEETREGLRTETIKLLRRLWRSSGVYSIVRRFASEALSKATRNAGYDPGARELARVCLLPRAFVYEQQGYRNVGVFERDRKAHEDRKYRTKRNRSCLSPMDVVGGDVHHLDILIVRPDGSIATPKMIAWLDEATMRIFATFVVCDPGKSVRNEDVIQSYIDMTQAPGWGKPKRLYLDNGAEYNFAPFMDDALKLREAGTEIFDRQSQITRAKPYNAQAKIIEAVFGLLERNYFSSLSGWIGGDRMKSKTSNVGKAPAPNPDAHQLITVDLPATITVYETQPQLGALGGKSPREVFNDAVAAGWERTDVNPLALRLAFAEERPKRITNGVVSVKGVQYTGRCLREYQARGWPVSVLVPKYESWNVLPVKGRDGQFIGTVELRPEFDALDPAGAQDAYEGGRDLEREIRRMAREAPPVDMAALFRAAAAKAEPEAIPSSAGEIGFADDVKSIGQQVFSETPAERRDREDDENQALFDEQKRRIEAYYHRKVG